MKKLIGLLILILPFYSTFCVDISKIRFEYLTVDDGLSQGIVEDIYQDRNGYMWFATRDGLNRYDGAQFITFRNDANDPNSLASSFVTAISEDANGRIWVGSAGLNYFDPRLNKMFRVKENHDNPDAFQGTSRVYSITPDKDSSLWICTVNGLIHYSPKLNKFRTFRYEEGKSGTLGSNTVYSICITRENRVFVATGDDFIYEFDRKTEKFSSISYKLNYYGNNGTKYIMEDSKGDLYITSEFAGVHIYNPSTGLSRLIDKGPGGLNAISIKTRIVMVSPEELWIGTDGGGINIYNPYTGNMKFLVSDSKISNSLSGNAIFKIYQDRDKNVWVGHFGTGISVWKYSKEKFTSYTHNPFNPESINKEVVTAIFEDSKGRIWVGQDGGGLSLFREKDKVFEHIRHSENDRYSLTSDIILAINEDPSGNLLLGTYLGGFMVFDPETRRVIKSFNTSNGIPSNHIWWIYRDSQDRYWVAFLAAGYGLYNPEEMTFDPVGNSGPLACANVIMNISEDKEGRIWFGSESEGVCMLDYDAGEIKKYRHDDNKNSLSYNDVKGFVMEENTVWIATNGGGLNKLDLQTDSFTAYTMSDGLSSNALSAILKDRNGHFWMSSTRGIMKFDPSSGITEIFDKSQGLQASEFKYNAYCQLSDGRMVFGGVNGITVFHPDSIKSSNILPGIVFTDFKIHNESVSIGVKGSPLKKHLNFTDRIKLNHKQSVFTIEFASLDYNSPEKNQYMYKLEGFDDEWISAGNRRFVTYTNLDPGKYTFLLKGSNSDGVWNPNPRKITIRVRPPWYSTKLAILIYVIAVILGIIWFILQREKQVAKDKLILEQKIEEAQAELKSKTRKVEEHENEIKRRNEEEKEIRFFTEGVAKMSDIIAKKRQNLEELSSSVISELVTYVDASAGGIFVMDDSDEHQHILKASGEFCLSSDEKVSREFQIGEGNIGTCYKEMQTMVSDNIPDGYIMLKSGLGNISLHNVVYVPVVQDNTPIGVIEIASIEKLSEIKIKFIEKIAESLASIIAIIKANEKSRLMIEMNNAQAEELRAQEEEMRQNMEELLATQEESERRERKIVSEAEEKDKLIRQLQQEIADLKKKPA